MRRLVLRSARANWRRFTLTAAAVVVGVSFVVGSFVLTDSLAASIDRLLADATGHTDFVIRSAEAGTRGRGNPLGGGMGRGLAAGVPASNVAAVEAVPGVAAVDVSVVGAAELLDKAGDAAAFDVAPLSNWPDHPEMSALHLVAGRAPRADDEIVVDSATAVDRGLRPGSTVRVATRRQGVVTARVVGLAQRGSGDLGVAGSILAVTLARATELVGTPGEVAGISVAVAPGTALEPTRRALAAAVGPSASVLDADALLADAQSRIQSRLTTFTGLMLGFATVTLFVSAFLIWNTFSMVVAQRRRELALLRAVGATARQVSRSLTTEAAVIGAAASLGGTGVGVLIAIGLRRLLDSFGIDLPATDLVVAPRTAVVAVAVGLGVTLVSVIGPARRTTRIPPVAAMSAAAVPTPRASRRAALTGATFTLMGAAAALAAVLDASGDTGRRMALLGAGAVAAIAGVTLLARYLAPPVVSALGRPFGGVAGRIARRNAVRDPRRTASTSAALMIGITLVAAALVVGESVKSSFGGALRASIDADVVVDASGIAPLDDATLARLRGVDGVGSLTPIPFTRARMNGTGERGRIGITSADPVDLARAVDPGFTEGTWPSTATGIAVSRAFADEHHLTVGGTVTLRADGVDRPLEVTGTYRRDELLDDAVALPAATAGLAGVETFTNVALVDLASGTSANAVLRRLRRATAAVPNSAARTTDDYVRSQTSALDVVLAIVNLLLLFAIGVAAMGVTNTLALSVVERTREIGLLRAVGMEARRVRRMVRIEGVLVALLGGVMGLVLGAAFGAAAAIALPADTAQLAFPWARLLLLLLAAGAVGVLAGALPARRAARLDVLAAIGAE